MADIGLSAAELLEVVEAGTAANVAQRGRTLLAAALADLPSPQLDERSLGDREAWVLALRCGTFGDRLVSRVSCPRCGLLLTVRIPREHVALQPPSTVAQMGRVQVQDGALVAEVRAPDGSALARAAEQRDVAAARRSLISSCVISVLRDGEPVDPSELDGGFLERVGEAIVAAEPQVEARVAMTCAGCGLEWAPILDVVQYFWRELVTASAQLLDEVHQLAIGYGWSEDQVLRLSSRRRRQYVERLTNA